MQPDYGAYYDSTTAASVVASMVLGGVTLAQKIDIR